jgi:hypothetical protein
VSSDYSSILLQFRSRSKTAEERILCGQQVEAQLAGGLVTTRILLTTLALPHGVRSLGFDEQIPHTPERREENPV